MQERSRRSTHSLDSRCLPIPAPTSSAANQEPKRPQDEQHQRHPKESFGHESQAEDYDHQDQHQNQSEHPNLPKVLCANRFFRSAKSLWHPSATSKCLRFLSSGTDAREERSATTGARSAKNETTTTPVPLGFSRAPAIPNRASGVGALTAPRGRAFLVPWLVGMHNFGVLNTCFATWPHHPSKNGGRSDGGASSCLCFRSLTGQGRRSLCGRGRHRSFRPHRGRPIHRARLFAL